MRIYLDDDAVERHPPDETWVRVFTPQEFKALIEKCQRENIPIEAISFDNDLGIAGLENEGHGLLKWLAENHPKCLVNENIELTVHSANETAKREILAKLDFYRQHKAELLSAKDRPNPFGEVVR